MTKAKAIKYIQDLIDHKKFCVQTFDEEKFTSNAEPLRAGLASMAQSDIKALQRVLDELKPKK